MSDLKSNTGLVCPTHGGSGTPRMDEAIRKGGRKTPYNVATEAKNIERELAAMTAERDAEKAQHQDTLNRFNSTLLRQSSLVEQVDSLCEERDTLRARVAELEAQFEEYSGWSKWKAGLWLIEHGEASHGATYIGEKP